MARAKPGLECTLAGDQERQNMDQSRSFESGCSDSCFGSSWLEHRTTTAPIALFLTSFSGPFCPGCG